MRHQKDLMSREETSNCRVYESVYGASYAHRIVEKHELADGC